MLRDETIAEVARLILADVKDGVEVVDFSIHLASNECITYDYTVDGKLLVDGLYVTSNSIDRKLQDDKKEVARKI